MVEVFREERNGIRLVLALDQPGPGNAYHLYEIVHNDGNMHAADEVLGRFKFQNGPIKEAGVNGIHNEDLLAIVAHRLECFQTSVFACSENGEALHHIQEAMKSLKSRTTRRVAEGKEGTNTV